MTPPTLPNELLAEVFTQLSSSKSTLFNVCLASRAFYDIAKPFLYSYITIRTQRRRRLLKRVKKEHAKLVKTLIIDGGQADDSYGYKLEGNDLYREEGHRCLVELFEGSFLDLSTLEVLRIVGILGARHPAPNLEKIKPASNLVELSVRGHRHGASFWDAVLSPEQNRPRLLRVGFVGVTYERGGRRCLFGEDDFVRHSPILSRVTPSIEVVFLNHYVGEMAQSNGVLICGSHLVPITSLWVAYHGCNVYLLPSEDSRSIRTLTATLEHMLGAIHSLPRRSRYFSLPWLFPELPLECQSMLSAMRELGVEFHYLDEDDRQEEEEYSPSLSNPLIPQSFVEFVAKQKEMEKEKEKEKEEED
ncbi:uncharacterized protein JCM6883_000782 [Sporobolomyces salmoneus]|uniref:uncharacterized protein n=1 Tax=Sporobolomyces salmoneus TaxID=183962 RepID=UPI0031808E35